MRVVYLARSGAMVRRPLHFTQTALLARRLWVRNVVIQSVAQSRARQQTLHLSKNKKFLEVLRAVVNPQRLGTSSRTS